MGRETAREGRGGPGKKKTKGRAKKWSAINKNLIIIRNYFEH